MVASEMYQEQEEIFELGDFRCYVAKKNKMVQELKYWRRMAFRTNA